jgi:LPXTG-site transpeptidase (sortase) family protein
MTTTALLWLERLLFAVGAALAVWCAIVLIEAGFTSSLPIAPRQTWSRSLPGDDGANPLRSSSRPAPPRGTVLARLEAPTLQLSANVLEGSDDRTLRRGAGHIEDTALPGDPGNVAIAGHRDTIFRALRRASVGDPLDLRTSDRVLHYRVSKTLIVDPDDVYVLDPTPQPTLTLVTCYPFEFIGHAPKRFIVQATLEREDAVQGRKAEGQEGTK